MDELILDAAHEIASGDAIEGLKKLDGLLVEVCQINAGANGKPTSSINGTGRFACEVLFQRSRTRQFLELQDNAMYNITSIMARELCKLGTLPEDLTLEEERRVLIMLDLIQGCCLLHYQSRNIFGNERTMQAVLRLIGQSAPQQLQLSGISTLVSILVHNVRNIRLLERLDGIAQICSLFKKRDTSKDVKLRILEFLFFYLIPETSKSNSDHDESTRVYERKSTRDKQEILENYLSNVAGLVREFESSKPFGEIALDW